MYICERCKGQVEKRIPVAKIRHYKEDGNIEMEEKVCFYCKHKEELKRGNIN